MAENLLNRVFIDQSDFPCADGFDPCTMKERTLSFALFVDIPTQPITPEAVFKECCYNHIVLASSTSSSKEKNDFTGFYHKRQLANETLEFVMIDLSDSSEYILNDDTYGVFKNFNSFDDQPDLATFVLDWRLVLLDTNLGPGSYKVVKRTNLAGLAVEEEFLVYNLQEFSSERADNTVRIDVTMSGLLERPNIDFTGTDFKTSLRVPGFFGRREPSWEEDNIVNRQFEKRQISMRQTNQFKFQTNMVPDCITNEIVDFMLFSDDIRMTDYNLNNHSYDFVDFCVKLANNEGTRYIPQSRKAQLNLVFDDKIVDNNKRNF